MRTDFNPSNNSTVDNAKKMAAIAINYLNDGNEDMAFARAVDFGVNGFSEMVHNLMYEGNDVQKADEFERLKNEAKKALSTCKRGFFKERNMIQVELAAMWIVKALTV